MNDPLLKPIAEHQPHESEAQYAVRLANAVLDRADRFGAIDPDGDLAVLARQYLRVQGLI